MISRSWFKWGQLALASVGLDADEERNRYDFYTKHFAVPLEGDTGTS